MKTELEIANERILELEKQVKKLSSNTMLADEVCDHSNSRWTHSNNKYECQDCGELFD